MNDLDEVVKCSEEMLQAAEAGAWSEVARAEETRRGLLNRLFADPGVGSIPEINKIIQTIIDINKHLERLAIEARDRTRVDMDKIREGRLAVNTYVQHT